MEKTFWSQLDGLYESKWPQILEEAKAKTLVFGAPVSKSQEFNFDEMSKSISADAVEVNSSLEGILLSENCFFSGSTLTSQTSNLVHLASPIVLPPVEGSLVENLSDTDDPLPCAPTFKFNNDKAAEKFESIVTTRAPIMYFFAKLKGFESNEKPIVELEKVELWAVDNGKYKPTEFVLSVDRSQSYDEFAQSMLKSEIQNSPATNPSLSKDEVFNSQVIFASSMSYLQFFEGGKEMYLRNDFGGSVSLARYVAEEVNGQPVFRLKGAEGQGADRFAQSIFFPGSSEPYGSGSFIYGIGYTTGFGFLLNQERMTGNLKENFDANR